MELSGKNYTGRTPTANGTKQFQGQDPVIGTPLLPRFTEALNREMDAALELAEKAFESYRNINAGKKAVFLRTIADEILALDEVLVQRVMQETAYPEQRVKGERMRTVNQLRMFADVVEEGSWVDARIDTAQPGREPLPKPDLRRMLMPLGSVVVFGASNFPLAFSVAGGDTTSALAAGCPVVFKAHPAHPGTSELVARAIIKAADKTEMPDGVFSLIHGVSHETGAYLVRHPLTRAVGFTGSLKGGRALFDIAAGRPVPIPVYAEMGSINPVFVLPSALENNQDAIAEGYFNSMTMGTGQFCTKPGVLAGCRSAKWDQFAGSLSDRVKQAPAGTMLYPALSRSYRELVAQVSRIDGVEMMAGSYESRDKTDPDSCQAEATVLGTDGRTFLDTEALSQEIFGPCSLIVQAGTPEELEEIAGRLEGQLTVSIHATEDDLKNHIRLIDILRQKAGRIIFNGFPTGVEVCPSMHHGGPYPATTDIRSTSVGTAAIQRFARPVCYQDFPDQVLPAELQQGNPAGIWRLVDNQFTNR